MVLNKDIGFVREGQDAVVRIESFHYTRHGTLTGKVVSVSHDAMQHEQLGLTRRSRCVSGSLETQIPLKHENRMNPMSTRSIRMTERRQSGLVSTWKAALLAIWMPAAAFAAPTERIFRDGFGSLDCPCSVTANPLAAANLASVGTRAWTNPAGVLAVGGGTASATALTSGNVTQYLYASNFGFAIPTEATLTGITATVRRRSILIPIAGGNPFIADHSIRLILNGAAAGADYATSSGWHSTPTFAPMNYGGSGNLWGLTLMPADVNSASFGIGLSAKYVSGNFSDDAYIDNVQLTIEYR